MSLRKLLPLALLLAACSQEPKVTYTPTPWEKLPAWSAENLTAVPQALTHSCAYFKSQPAEAPLLATADLGTVGAFQTFCAEASQIPASQLKTLMMKRLMPYEVRDSRWFTAPRPLFTGYFEPEIEASLTPAPGYTVPLHSKPATYTTADLGLFDPTLKNRTLTGWVQNGKLVPLPARAEVMQGALATVPALLWAKDKLEVFAMQVQGSGRAHLPDGQSVGIGYAGNNGYPYVSIGKVLIDKGAIKREDATMDTILAWLRAHPAEADDILNTNPRYIFYQFRPGPVQGALHMPLTPMRSLAVDPTYVPLGVPLYVSTRQTATDMPFQHLMFAQDTGGAITGAVRGDIFFGTGPDARHFASHQRSPGQLYILAPVKTQ